MAPFNIITMWRNASRDLLYTRSLINTIERGNQREYCGNDNTVVAIGIKSFPPVSIYDITDQSESYPDFFYDTCTHFDSVNQSKMYQFYLSRKNDVHPRHCLELCSKYQQKYALLNSNKCLCANNGIEKKFDRGLLPTLTQCLHECDGNHFYSCGNIANTSMYSVYSMWAKCPRGFQITVDGHRCVRADVWRNKTSFSSAQSYCESVGGMLAKINDVLEIQDILISSKLTDNAFEQTSFSFRTPHHEQARYFWINHTSDISNGNIKLKFPMRKCSQKPSESVDQNCIAVNYEKTLIYNIPSYERCITESNECSSKSAIPVCVDRHLKSDSSFIHSTGVSDHSSVSVNTAIDYSCGNDTEYHLIDEYCYKVNIHETTWKEAKSQCERDNAMLFIPEKSITVEFIKSLLLHRQSYTSSGFVHVGVIYDNKTRTVKQDTHANRSILLNTEYSNTLYDLCERTFRWSYEALMSSSKLSKKEKERLKTEQTSCAYIDIRSEDTKSVSCDEILCNRLAAVVCQKAPIIETRAVLVTSSSSMNNEFNFKKSRSKRFAAMPFIFATIFIVTLTGLTYILYNRYSKRKNNNKRQIAERDTDDSVYSPLSTGSDLK
ncbi:unnamed protein product [Rotaria magnacalcarata]